VPLTELSVIRHEPDNRFLECALAGDAEFIVTVNTAPGHFDQKQYQAVSVAGPTEFLNVPEVGRLVKKLVRG
jgi:predicted nucleic acid-binding protein